MLGRAYGKRPEKSAGKRGNGGESQGEIPLIQRHAHNGLTGAWRDETHYPPRRQPGTGVSCHSNQQKTRPGQVSSVVRRGPLGGTISPPVPPFPPRPVPPTATPLPVRIRTMSDPSERPWSSSDSAPQITKHHYTAEKATLAGSFIGSILYGIPAHTFVYSRSLRLFDLP